MNQVRADLPPEAEIPAINLEPSDAQFAAMYLSFDSPILEDNQVTDYLIRIVQPRLVMDAANLADLLVELNRELRINEMIVRSLTLKVEPRLVEALVEHAKGTQKAKPAAEAAPAAAAAPAPQPA